MKSYIPLFATLLLGVSPLHAQTAPQKIGHPTFLSPHANPIVIQAGQVFVANTPADSVEVIDVATRKVTKRIPVGVDPISLAFRPDGKELWAANHVSDSVSVIDTDAQSATYLNVIATVQDMDLPSRSTRFDEPVGIAFASNAKAYVALSSENQIAVVDVASRKVRAHLDIPAQDPRAIFVRNDRLYVLPFESNNKTQLSGGYKIDNKLVTFNAHEHSIANNNILSLGHVVDIIKHPRVPDRDLFVFDTRTDKLVRSVDTLGTLLYGLTVDSKGTVFIAQADARNDANGKSGTKKHGLGELENRAFLNQVTKVTFNRDQAGKPEFFNLEPLPPKHPAPNAALATPFAITLSPDDATLYVSAASSDKLFTLDAESGEVLGSTLVDAVPRGIALEVDHGKATRAWVLNAVANTVSVVDVRNPSQLKVGARIPLVDPTHPAFKRGRIAFNTASASSTKTFSCASCHPDGHTDQLLWVLKTPIVSGGKQIQPRSTMPVRGLRDTAPFHWDGIPGDPYGGNNSANIHGSDEPNCDINSAESATRHLIDGGLASTMLRVGDPLKNDEGLSGALSARQRDDMAKFLLNVTYPPAQRRAYSNVLSKEAQEGFDLFHLQGNHEGKPKPNVCGDCHRMPFWVSTNTPGSGMDAPTWRGAYDRFLILPQGRLNIIDFKFYQRSAEKGIPERDMWRLTWRGKERFDPVWDMVLEGSTGFSGAFARQVTVNTSTTKDRPTADLLGALEAAASEGAVVLQVDAVFVRGNTAREATLQWDGQHEGGRYVMTQSPRRAFSREQLLNWASDGRFVGTFTGRHGADADYDHPQPALWTRGTLHAQVGRQVFPTVGGNQRTMKVSGRHIDPGAHVVVNGRRVAGRVEQTGQDAYDIHLRELPSSTGIHFIQVQNRNGLFSNDFIFHVNKDGNAPAPAVDTGELKDALHVAIVQGNLEETQRLLNAGAPVNGRHEESGMPPLTTAAFYGRLDIATFLLKEKGARVNHGNRDGNTALHIAAFLCRHDIVELLLKHHASLTHRNERSERPVDTVAGDWSNELKGFYDMVIHSGKLELKSLDMRKKRPEMRKMLEAISES